MQRAAESTRGQNTENTHRIVHSSSQIDVSSSVGNMSIIVPRKHALCPTCGLLGSGHPTLTCHMAVNWLCSSLATPPTPPILSPCLSNVQYLQQHFLASCIMHALVFSSGGLKLLPFAHCCCWIQMKSPLGEQMLQDQTQLYSYLCNYAFTIKEH